MQIQIEESPKKRLHKKMDDPNPKELLNPDDVQIDMADETSGKDGPKEGQKGYKDMKVYGYRWVIVACFILYTLLSYIYTVSFAPIVILTSTAYGVEEYLINTIYGGTQIGYLIFAPQTN